MMSEFVKVGEEIEIPGWRVNCKITDVNEDTAVCINMVGKEYKICEKEGELFVITNEGNIRLNIKRRETPEEIEYKNKLRSKSNIELDREFFRINKLRNTTDNDYIMEFRCLNNEAGRRYHELPNEKTEDQINFFANQFSGYINWTQYNFKEKQFIINHRLSDEWVIYYDIPRVEYQAFLKADDKDEYIKDFEKRYHGERI